MFARIPTSIKAPTVRQTGLNSFSKPYQRTKTFSTQSKSTKLWGGRFEKDVSDDIRTWTESITVDNHLVMEDIWGSMAHVSMLGKQKIIPAKDAGAILKTLHDIQEDYKSGKWKLSFEQEDVHMNVEKTVITRVGPNGGRMHTTRSRNDQVVLDSKLYCRKRLLELRRKTIAAANSFLEKAKSHKEDLCVGYTHVQHAQPISVAYWLTHYAGVMIRDLDRLSAAYNTTDQNPLGAGALAGTSFPIDRMLTTELLGFQQVHEHGLDATSSRDFFLESASASAILNTTLSRLAEELILWSSYEFRTVILDDGFAMGSSMMPQKKNPGTLELLRGRAGRINGLMVAAFTMMKGLPSGYNRDFHEDKEILVEILSLVNRAIDIVPALMRTTKLNLQRMAELSEKNFATATELANYLVSKHSVPFREAHHIVGSLVGELYRAGQNFSNTEYCFNHLKKAGINAPKEEVLKVLDSKKVMLSYNSLGGTGAISVGNMIENMSQALHNHELKLNADQRRVERAHQAAQEIAKNAGSVQSADDLALLIDKFHPRRNID